MGLPAGRLAIAAGGLVLGLVAERGVPAAYGLVAFFAPATLAAGLALARWRGRSLDAWALLWIRFWWRQHLPKRPRGKAQIAAPPAVEILEEPAHGWAVIKERLAHGDMAWSCVLDVGGKDLTLATEEGKDALLNRWGSILAGLAGEGTRIRRLQLIDRLLMEPYDDHFDHLKTAGERSSPFHHAYWEEQLALPWMARHHRLLVLQVALSSAARPFASNGGGDAGAFAELRQAAERLRTDLGQLLGNARVLNVAELSWLLRTAYDPGSADIGIGLSSPSSVNQPSQREEFASLRTGTWWHATFRVARWPQTPVEAAFLLPLLLEASAPQSISVVLGPLPPSVALRSALAARTAHLSDAGLRQRHGFLDTGVGERERAHAARREHELTSGEQEYFLAAHLTVSARSQEELEAMVASLQAKAGRCGLELERMVGEQATAFSYCLPLGRGLKA